MYGCVWKLLIVFVLFRTCSCLVTRKIWDLLWAQKLFVFDSWPWNCLEHVVVVGCCRSKDLGCKRRTHLTTVFVVGYVVNDWLSVIVGYNGFNSQQLFVSDRWPWNRLEPIIVCSCRIFDYLKFRQSTLSPLWKTVCCTQSQIVAGYAIVWPWNQLSLSLAINVLYAVLDCLRRLLFSNRWLHRFSTVQDHCQSWNWPEHVSYVTWSENTFMSFSLAMCFTYSEIDRLWLLATTD